MKKYENKKFFNADAEDVLAPPLFRGGVRGTRTEGFSLPCEPYRLMLDCNFNREGWRPRRPKRAFNQKNRVSHLYSVSFLQCSSYAHCCWKSKAPFHFLACFTSCRLRLSHSVFLFKGFARLSYYQFYWKYSKKIVVLKRLFLYFFYIDDINNIQM